MFTYFSCFPYSLSVPDALGCNAFRGRGVIAAPLAYLNLTGGAELISCAIVHPLRNLYVSVTEGLKR